MIAEYEFVLTMMDSQSPLVAASDFFMHFVSGGSLNIMNKTTILFKERTYHNEMIVLFLRDRFQITQFIKKERATENK